MDKYNLSAEDANEILSHIQKKQKLEKDQNPKNQNNSNLNNIPNKKDENPTTILQKTLRTKKNSNKPVHKESYGNRDKTQKTSLKNEANTSSHLYKHAKIDTNNKTKSKNDKIITKKQTSIPNHVENNESEQHKTAFNQIEGKLETNDMKVDTILSNIVPDYNQQISIDLKHVDLTFEVQNEKVDTLKETFIRTIKRSKTKKIKIHALKDITFKIYKGEKVGIIGYNGAGKSTLLNVITGIYPPDYGTVSTNGNISPLLSLGAGFDHNFSGRKNIILNGAVLGYDKEYLNSKLDEIIEFSELGEYIDIPIKNYSSGMLAKLAFSIATAVNPDILIIDEILGVGDVNFQKKSRDKIRSLMDGGTTVLLVSHSIPQIRELCDKAIWIDNGHLRKMGEVNKVCDEYLSDAEKASNEQLKNIKLRS
ncbi:ABC transporter ATP-binding protein [Methanobrevibacter sp.]|uniref:ABC transporter ATP-binding protein n=1 Tax=Methanobrevibacter sp. TaxID=66852 RepID=UPI0025D36B23|nr:ABC transporter ATP-binding protein [Methanobrevibacter sp.]